MVQVTKVFYRQSQQCRGSFHSNFCTREEASNPACVGNETCTFTTPYIYLSPECGYSNNFLITYKCIPAALPRNVCEEGKLEAASGYIVSPSYPAKYPAGSNCMVTVTTPPGTVIQVYLLDLYLAYYNYDVTRQCVDTLWVVGKDEKDRTGYLCSGMQRGLVFTSKSNQITIYFTSKGHSFLNAKGFWLFFQGVAQTPVPEVTNDPPLGDGDHTPRIIPATHSNTDIVHRLRASNKLHGVTATHPGSITHTASITHTVGVTHHAGGVTHHTVGVPHTVSVSGRGEGAAAVTKPARVEGKEADDNGKEMAAKKMAKKKGKTPKRTPKQRRGKGKKAGKGTSKGSRKVTKKKVEVMTGTLKTSPLTTASMTTPTTTTTTTTTTVKPPTPTTQTTLPELAPTRPDRTQPQSSSRTQLPLVTTTATITGHISSNTTTTSDGSPSPTRRLPLAGSGRTALPPGGDPSTQPYVLRTFPIPTTLTTPPSHGAANKPPGAHITHVFSPIPPSGPFMGNAASSVSLTHQAAPPTTTKTTAAVQNATTLTAPPAQHPPQLRPAGFGVTNGTTFVSPWGLAGVAGNASSGWAVTMTTSVSRPKVPLWAKEPPPKHAAVLFRKISDTTRKGIMGGAGGCLFLVLLVVVLAVLIKRRNRNKALAPSPLPPTTNCEDYADIILAYGSNDTTRGFINVGFENESLSEFPMDSASQGSGGGWVGTLGSARGLNPIDEGPEIVYMDAKTAALQNAVGNKKARKGPAKVRWVKSKSLDDIRNTIRHTQSQVTGRRARSGGDDGEKEPFSVSSGWLGEDLDSSSAGGASPRSGPARLGTGHQYHTMSNLNSDSCVSEATLYSTSASSQAFNFSHHDLVKADCSPYETVHFQHQDEVAL